LSAGRLGTLNSQLLTINPFTAKWWNWDTHDAQNVAPARAWEFESLLGYLKRLQARGSRLKGIEFNLQAAAYRLQPDVAGEPALTEAS
jgi:hypothetical protein